MKVMPRSTAALDDADALRLLDRLLRRCGTRQPDRRDRLARPAELAVEHVPPELAGIAPLRQGRGTAGGAVGDRLGRGRHDGGAGKSGRGGGEKGAALHGSSPKGPALTGQDEPGFASAGPLYQPRSGRRHPACGRGAGRAPAKASDVRRGPFRSGKVPVFRACTPAVWSPLNGVVRFFRAAVRRRVLGRVEPEAEVEGVDRREGRVLAGASGRRGRGPAPAPAPTATAKVSTLNRPTKNCGPLPFWVVSTSPTYQPTPKGALGLLDREQVELRPRLRPFTVTVIFSAKPSKRGRHLRPWLSACRPPLEGTMVNVNGLAALGRRGQQRAAYGRDQHGQTVEAGR